MISKATVRLLNQWSKQYDRGELTRTIAASCANGSAFLQNGCLNYNYDGVYEDLRYAPQWFIDSLTSDPENPQMFTYLTKEPKPDAKFPAKPRTNSLAKLLSFAVDKLGLNMTPDSVERFSTWAGRYLVQPRFSHVTISGPDILDEYYTNRYGSCMYQHPQIAFYARNPESVEQVIVLNNHGERVGRALLWRTVSGNRMLERIYPSDSGAHIDYLLALAEENDWGYKTRQTYGSEYIDTDHLVTMRDYGVMPYPDTLSRTGYYVQDGVPMVAMSNSSGVTERFLRDKDRPRRTIRDDQMFCEFYGTYEPIHEFIYLRNLKAVASRRAVNELFVEINDDNYQLRDDMVRSTHLNRFLSTSEAVLASDGTWHHQDYPYLVRYTDNDFLLRSQLDWTDAGWVPGTGQGQDSAPLIEYRGLIQGQNYFGPNGAIYEVTQFWPNGDADKVLARNLRRGQPVLTPIDQLDTGRVVMDADVELFTNIPLQGDIMRLTAPMDATDLLGQVFPAGHLAIVQGFDEDPGKLFINLMPTGAGDTPYWYIANATQMVRVIRVGETLNGSTYRGSDGERATFAAPENGTILALSLAETLRLTTLNPAQETQEAALV